MYISRVILTKQQVLIKINENARFCTQSMEAIKMSYQVYETKDVLGSGHPLIMMHGLLGSKGNWRSVCKAFHRNTMPRRKIIAVDARNHGSSPHTSEHTYCNLVQDIKALLADLEFTKAALLGHSMGGRAVMYFALLNPDLVDKLIVGDISPITTSATFKSMMVLFDALREVTLPNNMTETAAKQAVNEQLLAILKDPAVCMFLLTNLGQRKDGSYKWKVNLPVLAESFETLLRFPFVEGLKFKGPVLFLTGGKSDFVPDSDRSEILKLFPNTQFAKIASAGHWLYTDKPHEFSRICLKFLNRRV